VRGGLSLSIIIWRIEGWGAKLPFALGPTNSLGGPGVHANHYTSDAVPLDKMKNQKKQKHYVTQHLIDQNTSNCCNSSNLWVFWELHSPVLPGISHKPRAAKRICRPQGKRKLGPPSFNSPNNDTQTKSTTHGVS
jgi:hypothetical protein